MQVSGDALCASMTEEDDDGERDEERGKEGGAKASENCGTVGGGS